jgi:uncharacterized protein (DUF427 family)
MVLAATATFNLNNLQRRATPSSAASSNQGVIPMTDTRTQLIPGPDHPITVERWPGHVTVRRGTVVIAETDRAFELRESTYPAVYYVPLDDVHRDFLRRSEVHTWCPYKGEASYFDLIATKDTDEMPASVWYYPDPFAAVGDIKDHVAFYADRFTVSAMPAD